MKGLFAFAAAAGVANAFVARGYSNTTTEEMTTSTIYATQIRTVTHCPETVTDCPLKPSVVTETIAISTTVCPVTQVHPPVTTHVAPPPPPAGNWTSTLYTTKTYVISKCPPEVPHCPVGETTTTIYATATTCYTDVPVKPTHPVYTPPAGCKGDECKPPVETPGKPSVPTPVSPPVQTPPAGCKGDECKVPSQPVTPPAATSPAGCKGDQCKPVTPPAATTPVVVVPKPSGTAPAQVTAGAARNGFEIAAAAAGLAALFL